MMDLILKKPDRSRILVAGVTRGPSPWRATVVTVVTPFVETDTLGSARMKQVSSERERIRAREREKLAKSGKGSLRPEAKAFMSRIVDGFNVSKWLGTETAKTQLAMAGYRGQGCRSDVPVLSPDHAAALRTCRHGPIFSCSPISPGRRA